VGWLKGFFTKAKASPKTSSAGLLAFLSALFLCLQYQFDVDPATVPNWDSLLEMFLVMLVALNSQDAPKSETPPAT
jgi:hypothetical protein